jgi:hypothetical protein
VANEDRLAHALLTEWERLAHDGLRGGLLEQAWSRRALALVREIRLLKQEVETRSSACAACRQPPPDR